jgi:phosphoribosylamine---glycine ligase
MNVLLLGSGGREHALAWKISQSKLCTKLWIAPGNAGTSQVAENIDIQVHDFESIKMFCINNAVEMVIVGPEDPLVQGIVDFFANDSSLKNIAIVGPDKYAAQLEGSKAFAKEFMKEYGIPTAKYKEFDKTNAEEGIKYIKAHPLPIVLKADGLAAGKGVLIIDNYAEAITEFNAMLEGKFGVAGNKVVIEQFLSGIEFSVFAITDGLYYKILPVAKDYKRIGEGDKGLNTGGMGAVSPVPFVDDIMMQKVTSRIIEPTIKGIHSRGMVYKGFVFIGLIEVNGEPFVIEYNCRMGDPETEVVIPRLDNDFMELMQSLFDGKLQSKNIIQKQESCTTIVLVAGGYPGAYEKGNAITGLENIESSLIFHAGTKVENDKLTTNGGRLLAVTSLGESIEDAIAISNSNAAKIVYKDKYYRKDIGRDLV